MPTHDKENTSCLYYFFKSIYEDLKIILAIIIFFLVVHIFLFFSGFFDRHTQVFLGMGLRFYENSIIIPFRSVTPVSYTRDSHKALWKPDSYYDIKLFSDFDNQTKVSLYSPSEFFMLYKENKIIAGITDKYTPVFALKGYSLMKDITTKKASTEEYIDNQMIYFLIDKNVDEYNCKIIVYNSEKNQIEKQLTIPWEGQGIPKVLKGGKKVFLFYTSLIIVNLDDNSIDTVSFEMIPWPYSVSEDGTTVVWVQKEDTRQRAVVYDVDKREVVSDIFLENYGGGVKSIAVQPHSSYLAVGYQRNLKTVPKVVIYNYEEKKAVKSLYLDKKGFYIK